MKNDIEGLRRLLLPNLGNLFGILRPNINERNPGGFTPLMNAAQCGCKEAVAFLLQNGADAGAKDNGGQTALDEAQEYRHPEVVALLTGK